LLFELIFLSAQNPGETGPFYLNIYFGCDEKDIQIKHINGNFPCIPIAEEEEEIEQYDDKTKFIMKLW